MIAGWTIGGASRAADVLQAWRGRGCVAGMWLLLAGLALGLPGLSSAWAQTVAARPGAVDGSWLYLMPDTRTGLKPTQSWHATGATPAGTVFVGGMDHVSNAALYRINPATNRLTYVGDARAATERAGNLVPGETFEKFHTRPTWLAGKLYLATMDYSKIDAGYLARRGSHLYAFDPAAVQLTDLSAALPGGVSAAHLQVVTLAADPARKLIYQAAVPTGEILRYDVAGKRISNLGRPAPYDVPYLYVGRFMWVDSRGWLYLSAGHAPSRVTYDPAIYNRMYVYKPGRGFAALPTWRLQATRAIETGQCLAGGVCYVTDDQSRIYRFADSGPSWAYIGRVVGGDQIAWVFHLSRDGRTAYTVTSEETPGAVAALYEYDLVTRTARRLIAIRDIDPAFAGYNRHTGYNAWDDRGRFYFTSFPSASSPLFGKANVRVTAIDPVRLKAAVAGR
jgi:hypothetical protein